jgi:large subunit ribosomal protein L6
LHTCTEPEMASTAKDSKKGAEDGKKKPAELIVDIPQGVTVSVNGPKVTVKGPKGEVSKTFQLDRMTIEKKDNQVVLTMPSKRKGDKAVLGAANAHVVNMIHGVTNGVVYKMKVIYSHFPMNVKVQGPKLVIDNFLGEKHPRKTDILKGVTVEVKGQDVTLKGASIEDVSQTAANIEQITRITARDLRVFQDGIYITEKDGKPLR